MSLINPELIDRLIENLEPVRGPMLKMPCDGTMNGAGMDITFEIHDRFPAGNLNNLYRLQMQSYIGELARKEMGKFLWEMGMFR